MSSRFLLILGFCLLFLQWAVAQQKDSLSLSFHFKFKGQPLELAKSYITGQHDTLALHTVRFYISDITIQYQDHSTSNFSEGHLVDFQVPASQKINLPIATKKAIKSIAFSIGLDSLANISGALSGDLDPAKGMYWAWQSGYINMKIEGKSSSCNTRKNQFQFHIGGYLKPNNALRTVTLFPQRNGSITISADLAAFFADVSLSEINSIMIPGKRAMQLADSSVKMFSVE